MSDLVLATSWSTNGIPAALVSVRIIGLQMEGAHFENGKLELNTHNSPSICVAPTCTLAWLPMVRDDNFNYYVHNSMQNFLIIT